MEFPNQFDDNVSIHRDRISRMPDNVVSKILTLIPTKQAVRTSCLSTRLSHFLSSLGNLQFDDEFGPQNGWSKERSNRFKAFVSNVLSLQNPGLIAENFHLRCTVKRSRSGGVTPSDVTTWVSEALYRSLHLQIFSSVPVTVPENVFQSKTLVNLNLDSEKADLVVNLDENTEINLPSLKSLELISVTYTDDACVKRLFEACPELEEVYVERTKADNIVSCYCISGPKLKKVTVIFAIHDFTEFGISRSIQIMCPNMEYICVWNDFPFDLSIGYLSGITEAHFCVPSFDNDYAEKLLYLLRGMTAVKHLSLSASTMQALACMPGDRPLLVLNEDVIVDIGIENKHMLWPTASHREAANMHQLFIRRRERLISQILNQTWWEEPINRPKWLWECITELYIIVPADILNSDENRRVLLGVLREVKDLKGLTIQILTDLLPKTKEKVIKEIGLVSDCTIDFVM